ncbi:hypothetical protein GWO64_002955 [Corynebacterium macginleyi]|nr:hypothetical protein [Corynebacterium macginleyi]QRJ58370.1 hypothetical protein GWO64_002955 [Corynebacterium macginleyi]
MILGRNIFHHVKGRVDTLFAIVVQGLDNALIFKKFIDASASKFALVLTS